jgi:hypothetical protein
VKVYVESNFILEYALLQEQHVACERLISYSEAGRITLAMPAFALAEPYQTIGYRTQQRRILAESIANQFRQLSRSQNLADEVETFRDVTGFLVRSGEFELRALRATLQRLIGIAWLIPLDAPALARSWQIENEQSLVAPDAIILGSVLHDLETTMPPESIFLNRNIKDFDDPDIVALLLRKNCRLIPSFVDGLAFTENRLSSK